MKIFEKSNLKGDIFGGITAGIVALPLALAFGIQAFGVISVDDVPNIGAIGALAGLTGAIMIGFFASLFGGTPSQISGPTGPMTVISATLISGVWASSQPGNISTVIVSMSVAAILCGLFQILFGILKIGKYIRYIPYPVLSGFMSGIGIIIIVQQIYPLFGLKSPVLIVDMIMELPKHIGNLSWSALLLGLGTAESCTGGALSAQLTALAGASNYFVGGVVSYSNEVKESVLHVPHDILATHGAVSEPTAIHMAEGVRRQLHADYGIATTGIAGPGGGSPEKPVGTVWTAVATPTGTVTQKLSIPRRRAQVIEGACQQILGLLAKYLKERE